MNCDSEDRKNAPPAPAEASKAVCPKCGYSDDLVREGDSRYCLRCAVRVTPPPEPEAAEGKAIAAAICSAGIEMERDQLRKENAELRAQVARLEQQLSGS